MNERLKLRTHILEAVCPSCNWTNTFKTLVNVDSKTIRCPECGHQHDVLRIGDEPYVPYFPQAVGR